MLQDSLENEKYLELKPAVGDSFVKVNSFRRKSHDNYYIHGEIYEPADGEIRSLIFFIHGMSDYRRRYDSFARFLAGDGHAVVLFDLRGHGESLIDGQRGFFFYNEGSERQIDDISLLIAYFKGKYADPKTIIIGHSLGSLFARAFIKKNPSDLSGLLLLSSPAWKKGMNLAWIYSGIVSFFSPLAPAKTLLNRLFPKNENKSDEEKTAGSTGLRSPSINKKNSDDFSANNIESDSASNIRLAKIALPLNDIDSDGTYDSETDKLSDRSDDTDCTGLRNVRTVNINRDSASVSSNNLSERVNKLRDGATSAEGEVSASMSDSRSDQNKIRKSRTLYCGVAFKWRAMRDVFDLMREVYLSKNWTVTQRNLPIRFLTGVDDNNIAEVKSGGVERAVQRMRNLGYQNVEAVYFNRTGHDILFSQEHETIYKYIVDFLHSTTK